MIIPRTATGAKCADVLYRLGSEAQYRGKVRRAFKLFFDAAQAKHTRAIYELARCYEVGIGVARDFDAATRFFRLAGRQGLPEACTDLGALLERVGKVQMALKHYKKAAGSGDPIALVNLARCYHLGIGVRTNTYISNRMFREAIPLLRRNLKKDLGCMTALGQCYWFGWGVPRRQRLSKRLWKRAALSGHPRALEHVDDL